MAFMASENFSGRIFVGLTGRSECDWQGKLMEINKYRLAEIALFLERFCRPGRLRIYDALLQSCVQKIPLVHLKNDMSLDEVRFLYKNFGTRHFTIHENSFDVMGKWMGFYKSLYLEMNTDDSVSGKVDVSRIGGFCVDLSHFKVEEQKQSKEYDYVMKRKWVCRYFGCNHINGYSYLDNCDMHTVGSFRDFDYLKTLPEFVFGDVIGIELENSITEQMKYRRFLVGLLNKRFLQKA